MKLLFRPDPFIDKKGDKIELEDIEIEEVYSTCHNFITFSINKDYSIDVLSIKEIQESIEELWNYGDKGIFKIKNNLGRLDENSGTKLQLDLEVLKEMNKVLKTVNEVTEDELNAPNSPRVYIDSNTGKKMVKYPDGKTMEYNDIFGNEHDWYDYGNPDTIQCRKCGEFQVPWKDTKCLGENNG